MARFECTDFSILIASYRTSYQQYVFYCAGMRCLRKAKHGLEIYYGFDKVVMVLTLISFSIV